MGKGKGIGRGGLFGSGRKEEWGVERGRPQCVDEKGKNGEEAGGDDQTIMVARETETTLEEQETERIVRKERLEEQT